MTIKTVLKITLCTLFLSIGNQNKAQTIYQKDFQEFWTDINEHYAYLDQQNIDWKKVKDIYAPAADKINNNWDFIRLLENILNELYNGHSSLNTNLNTSNRLIPSGQDLYIEKKDNRYIVTDIRKGFGAEQSGIKIGMEITKFNNKNIDNQVKLFLPKFTNNPTPKMYQYAINMLFAGTHNTARELTVTENGTEKKYQLIDINPNTNNSLLTSTVLNDKTIVIKINNSLGNYELIPAFDKIIDQYINYKNIVVDLTETPNGGNSTIARAIMGRFTDKQLPYQVHELDEKQYQTKRHFVEYVSPRDKVYNGNVYILVGHWTGSMGEGIAIGFDGMKRAKIIGTKMAGLLGAISGFQLSETKIGYQFPTERLYHINGTPREDFIPKIYTKNIEETLQKSREIK